jgi:hypothetical protein
MFDDRTVIKVYMGKPDGGRKEVRSKLRWLVGIENDLKLMGIKRLKKKTKRGMYKLSFGKRYWLHYKDHMPKKKFLLISR